MQINGELDGEISCTSLIVAKSGKILGTIKAQSVEIDGFVEGPVQAEDVTIKAKAHVVGDIACKTVAIEKGAFIEGRILQSQGSPMLEAPSKFATSNGRKSAGAAATPDMLIDDAVAYMSKRGDAEAKPALVDGKGSKGGNGG
jgi:hypothetical protein